MTVHRSARVAEAIKEEVALILLHRLKDVRVQSANVTVVSVEVTGDLSHATVFVSIMGDDDLKESVFEGLYSAAGFIRSEIGKVIKLRSTPQIHFKLDHSIEHGANIAALLNKIREEKDLAAAEQSTGESGGDA
jgi:ribosome-binding factor A